MDNRLIELFGVLQDHPIAYRRIFSKVTGSVTAGLLLAQIAYWYWKMNNRTFYKTDNEFCDELGMGLYEFKAAKTALIDRGFISVERKGIPAKTHYTLDLEHLINLIIQYSKNHSIDDEKVDNKLVEKPPTITETTSEITSQSTYNENGFSEQKSIEGNKTNTSKRSYPLTSHLSGNPDEEETINEAIAYYLEKYETVLGKSHPNITPEQFEAVKGGFRGSEGVYDHIDYLSLEDYMTIIDSWFEDKNVVSDYNINHFSSGDVIKTHYYKSGLY